jgi:hypothetical protein
MIDIVIEATALARERVGQRLNSMDGVLVSLCLAAAQ